VVWYEVGSSALDLRSNDQVFAAKIVVDPTVDGGFHWQAVGNGTAAQINPLDTSSSPPGFGHCAASTAAEDACSLKSNPQREAEDSSVASGSLTLGGTTVPWVVCLEHTGTGRHAIFISRLVGGTHFELFNGGAALSNPSHDAVSPDITFFGNIPYVSWIESEAGKKLGFVGTSRANLFARHAGRDRARLNGAPRFADRLPGPNLVEPHRGPVHSGRDCVRGRTGQRSVRPVHARGHPSAAVRPSDHRWVNCALFPGCNGMTTEVDQKAV
jgi:hypothetical protein